MPDFDVHVPDDAIRLRSYLIWQQEGRPAGRELANWLCAKAELEAEAHAHPLPRRPVTTVMPRLQISKPPDKRVSRRIGRDAA